MKTVIESLEEIIPFGKHCNPDTSHHLIIFREY